MVIQTDCIFHRTVRAQELCKIIVSKTFDMVCNVTGYGGILFPQFLNALQQPVVLILGNRPDSLSKDRKLFAITTADTCKERQNINGKPFSVLDIFHNHIRV